MYTDIFAFCYENSSHKLCRCANETMMIKHTHGLAQNIAKYTDRRQWKSPPTATHPHDFDVELMISTITSVNIHKKGFLPDSINIEFCRLTEFLNGTTIDTFTPKAEDVTMTTERNDDLLRHFCGSHRIVMNEFSLLWKLLHNMFVLNSMCHLPSSISTS